ncbi:flagellar motor protein MotB [Phyllobacterium phragmitis]|uniref:Flagellar motor protein MotB n=1 Tax=Phyllobacterium phragmitis TaxID=2670329 RepID=A0A2S9IQ63_9HYPH|nr:MotB family protein [Phyllobacterium phragmitis]PRD42666.1 flagellar motor protein MotB [Phyllobacterium phragmitis]
MSIDPETHREIIIVRRGHGDDHEEHHGGVWKIAYADFMTAMMAFFLVMWLINATNEETKAAVASYFNPVKLIDRHSSRKGVEEIDLDEGKVRFESDKATEEGAKVINDKKAQTPSESEERLMFKEPYAVLAEIANETGIMQNQSKAGEGGAATAGPLTGSEGGEAYRDPFNPDYWSNRVDDELFPVTAGPVTPPLSPSTDAKETGPETQASDTAKVGKASADDKTDQAEKSNSAPVKAESLPEEKDLAEAEKLAREIRAATAAAKEPNSPDITVVPADGGVMIQLTDKIDYGMFAIGSAKPDRRVVEVLEKIAKIIAGRQGSVIISGHTDARPFKSDSYDNWRLSSARAQMAYYMLVRGGLDEKRVLRVEGYADRQPKKPEDAYAAENRRIDIFLKTAP